jgi:hypothetical protein
MIDGRKASGIAALPDSFVAHPARAVDTKRGNECKNKRFDCVDRRTGVSWPAWLPNAAHLTK